MPSWPTERRLIGRRTSRLEAPDKVTGRAKYTADVNLPGLLYAVGLPCPYGRARVNGVDTSAAEGLPGVKAIQVLAGRGRELRLHGDLVAVAVAETEDQARDALRALRIDYEVLPHCVTAEDAMAEGAPMLLDRGNTRDDKPVERGDVEQGFRQAAAIYEGTFSCSIVTHACLETHGGAAQWDGQRMVVWTSTQSVSAAGEAVARATNTPQANVEVICEHMGGGFGSKLGFDREASIAAQMARQLGRPVKFMLCREIDQTTAGSRPSATARIRIGANAEGRLVAFESSGYGTGGIGSGAHFHLPFIYNVPNVRSTKVDVATNSGSARAMRAPGHPESSFLMESAMDGLAEKLGIDPVEFRRRNVGGGAWHEQLRLGAERIGWANRQPTGSQTGPFRTGYGCALTQWWGAGHDSNCRIAIHSDGQVELWCGTQDIGTGTRTAMAVVAAETFGLQPSDIQVHIGHSSYPPSGGSGGSTTIGGVASAARTVGEQLLAQLFEAVAPALGATPDDLEVVEGGLRRRSQPQRRLSWRDACATLRGRTISAEANRDPSLTAGGTQGVHFVQVEADVETGIVRVVKVVALQNCGSVVNRLTAESQVIGGVIMGIGMALYEERVLCRQTGRMLNANLEFYKLPGPSDMPDIDVILQDEPNRPVIGIGEPPAIPTAAAIANATANAIGARVHSLPLTPDRVLEALAAQEA